MPFSRKSGEAAAAAKGESPGSGKKGSDLLIRFFESEWFDAFIALTYLYKSNSQGVQDYLCNRLYTLPERDVERYLSQLTQLCIQRPGSALERVIIDLCAQSLRIAVKAYWLLLAISQDNAKDAHVAALWDACEQAALDGHWQLPFKQTRLPPPLSPSPVRLPHPGQRTPLQVSPNGSFTAAQRPSWGVAGSSPELRRSVLTGGGGGGPLSPTGDVDSRPMSPDGLGGGIYSSVFMDTGVEGLIVGSPPPELRVPDLRSIRQHVDSPRASQGALLEGPGRPLLPVRVDAQRVSSLQQELGAGEGVSALLMRSSTAGEGGSPGVVRQSDSGAEVTAAAAAATGGGAVLFSPPNSPRRRQTTFGATLDFVETLCQASSSLTAFQPEDRQWALRRALQQINVEIEKASRNGVAIWFPMGDSNLRVVRLAPRESRLLNSREKAPFTLCVEVLDEEEATAAVEARAAQAVAATAAAAAAAVQQQEQQQEQQQYKAAGEGQYADSAKSLLVEQPPPLQLMQPLEDGPSAAAAAEAAAHGIQFVPNHHRSHSQDTSTSSMDAAATAAVRGSSAVTGDAVAMAAMQDRAASATDGGSSAPSSPRDSVVSGASSSQQQALASEPSFAGMLPEVPSPARQAAAAAAGAGSGGDCASPPLPRRLTTDLDAVSDAPSLSGGGSSLGSPPSAAEAAVGEADSLLGLSSPTSVHFDFRPGHAVRQQQQQGAQPPAQQAQQAQAALPPLALPQQGRSKLAGGGTWIGGAASSSSSPVAGSSAGGAAGAALGGSESSRRGPPSSRLDTVSSLETALAGLRGEAPLVSVRLEVLNDRPASSARGSSSSLAEQQQAAAAAAAAAGSPGDGAASSSAERRRASLDAASRAPPHQCDRSSWACKLGLCKLCNTKLATMGDDEDEPWLQPYVRVHFTVQGGVDLTIRRTPGKHQRMPSHEALLKVAKQHKLPVPALPPSPLSGRGQQTAAAAAAASAAAAQAAGGSSVQQRSPLGAQPAAAAPGGGGSSGAPADAAAAQQQAAAEAAYGEKWEARKERVQLASPHGRRPGWDLRCVIVKTGDDCRQELLAMQLIRAFHEIFTEAQLPLWLRPYEVLPTSNRTALIEMVPNAPSIHALKAKSPAGTSLRDHLAAKFVAGSPAFQRAQRCFVESLAAYSLVCYLLQIKDRHNGNILLDDEGHVIHIDFGFMLSNSPGGVNFESAPFKLTRELLEVMDSDSDGRASQLFDYFKVLMIQGFLAVRKHADRILLLVEMMQGSGCPCFKSRVAAVQGLKKRFHLALPEPQVVEVVLGLISDSLDAWRTRHYDYYQRVLNGIL